jgi:hypothetical protein
VDVPANQQIGLDQLTRRNSLKGKPYAIHQTVLLPDPDGSTQRDAPAVGVCGLVRNLCRPGRAAGLEDVTMSCQSCIYSAISLAGNSQQAGQLLCRAEPPKPQGIAVPQRDGISIQVVTLWPVVQKDDICGAYERNDNIKPS